jgi:predicted nuclease of restriction endonuclease-like (RecB) superfamily
VAGPARKLLGGTPELAACRFLVVLTPGVHVRPVTRKKASMVAGGGLDRIAADLVELVEQAQRVVARSVNAGMTATYWEIGRRIFEEEQRGARRAGYGAQLLNGLAAKLSARFGRGFGARNLRLMRAFYVDRAEIWQTVSAKLDGSKIADQDAKIWSTPSARSPAHRIGELAVRFPLPWSHYVRLLSVSAVEARRFYETEALRGGWTVRQLDRQIETQFYERTMLSKNKHAMLEKGGVRQAGDEVTPEEEIKDPFVLEFLGLKDEYSESDLEDALVAKLESLLLEMGGDFAFVGRQRRLRIDDEWYRIDLLFFHRRLRCLVIVDLKLGKFTHADAGQMHLYLNYAREHWTVDGENPPVGLILCASKGEAVVKYALEGLSNKVLAATYRTTLPAPSLLASQIEKTRHAIESRLRSAPRRRPGKIS